MDFEFGIIFNLFGKGTNNGAKTGSYTIKKIDFRDGTK